MWGRGTCGSHLKLVNMMIYYMKLFAEKSNDIILSNCQKDPFLRQLGLFPPFFGPINFFFWKIK